MSKDKLKIYAMEIVLLLFLLLTLFESNIIPKFVLAVVLLIYMFISAFLLKKRKIISIYNKQVSILLIIFGFIYLAIFYLTGLYFGFYESIIKFNFGSLINYIIPTAVIIIASEVIRYIFISQQEKFSRVVTMIMMILIDLILYAGIYSFTNVDDLVMMLGFVLFASISCNLLYNYITVRFGYKGIIFYRMITILYVYFIPIVPNVYVFFRSFFRMLYPYFIYLILEYTYAKTNFAIPYKDKRKYVFTNAILLLIASGVIMLVSCQFRYGVLVIGSDSMAKKVDKGDVLFFEKYDKQQIKAGDVIVFKKGGMLIIHRVVDVKTVNNVRRYFTKGDANKTLDEGFVTDEEITGVSLFRIRYLGYPTIWIHDIFS